MKGMFSLSALSAVLAVLAAAGCQYPPEGVTGPEIPDLGVAPGEPVSEYPIWAGQNILIGTLSVYNDADYLYITYTLFDGWMLEETHVHVASDLSGIPCNRNGIPVPGQFAFGACHDPTVAVYTYAIEMEPWGFQYGDEVVVAAHAAVNKWDEVSQEYLEETAWGGDNPGPGPRWWFYALYVIQNPEGPGPGYSTETAWARMNDDPMDFTYPFNPPQPGPGNWATFLEVEPGESVQTFYFYAGQFIGTGEVEIWRDADYLYVSIVPDEGILVQDRHLNVQTGPYSGNPAPGLFPYNTYFEGNLATVPWEEAWSGAPLYVAVHGVVQIPE